MPLYRTERERDSGPDGGEKRLGFYNSAASGPHAAHLQTFDKRGEDFSREKERWGTGERKRRKENRISSTIISKRVPYLSFHGKKYKKQWYTFATGANVDFCLSPLKQSYI